jgi:hypothetical protein
MTKLRSNFTGGTRIKFGRAHETNTLMKFLRLSRGDTKTEEQESSAKNNNERYSWSETV